MQRRARKKERTGRKKGTRKIRASGRFIAAAVILLVLAVAVLLYTSWQKPEEQTPLIQAKLNNTVPPCFYTRSGHNVSCERLEAMLGPERMKGSRGHNLSAMLFAQLPRFPKDLHKAAIFVTLNYLNGSELAALGEEYWKQPEWYAGFGESGVKIMEGASGGVGAVYGYGTYKADTYRAARQGENFSEVFFFHASWGVRSYQGFMLVPSYNKSALAASVEPEIFLLTPTWPAFTSNWTQKVVVNVKVGENAAPGKYEIGIDAEPPPTEYSEKWRDPYTYAEPTFKMGFGRPVFRLHLTVG